VNRLRLDHLHHVLCLGAHADDIEIGAGGTVLRLLADDPTLAVTWVVLSACGPRADEARRGAEAFLAGAGARRVFLKEFRDSYFPWEGGAIKDFFEELKALPRPDLVLTHDGHDRHQDHRIVSELTWNTFRNHFILEYEVPQWDGGLGTPNLFVPLDEEVRRRKVEYLLTHFPTQRAKPWFSPETFNGLMRLRGVECHARSGHAEAFHCRKACL
jgi:LmbE family N-acetylglucosaminyl deacetylase